jgi:hypothetical protein
MNSSIEAIEAVSDGILVEFQGGVRCYFSAEFLLDNINRGSNRVFLEYDPTPNQMAQLSELSIASFSPFLTIASTHEN